MKMELSAKQRIAHTALTLFLEKGYHNTTIREIAQECGYSHVNVLRHYNTKGELAIHLVERYIMNLLGAVKNQADQIGIKPSQTYSDLYWLSHYHFLRDHPQFARLYCDTYESMRDDFHALLSMLSDAAHVPAQDLLGLTMQVPDAEAELFSKLVVDSDVNLVNMICREKVTPVWAVQKMTKLLMVLLFNNPEEQIELERTVLNQKMLEQQIQNVSNFLVMTILN